MDARPGGVKRHSRRPSPECNAPASGKSLMMEDEERALPRPDRLQPLRMDGLGVAELEAYIAELRGEIARAEAEIGRRRGHRSAADAVFGGGRG